MEENFVIRDGRFYLSKPAVEKWRPDGPETAFMTIFPGGTVSQVSMHDIKWSEWLDLARAIIAFEESRQTTTTEP